MKERLTWEEIKKKYPDQWVGLVDVKYKEDNANIKSAVVKYTDKSHDELLLLKMEEDLIHRYTTPDDEYAFYTQENGECHYYKIVLKENITM